LLPIFSPLQLGSCIFSEPRLHQKAGFCITDINIFLESRPRTPPPAPVASTLQHALLLLSVKHNVTRSTSKPLTNLPTS